MQADGGGDGDIERIDARSHRNPDDVITVSQGRPRQAVELLADDEPNAVGPVNQVKIDASFVQGGPNQRQIPSGLQPDEIARPVAAAHEWHGERVTDRNAQGFAIQWIVAAGAQRDGIDRERCGVAEEQPDVVDVRDVFSQQDGEWAVPAQRRGEVRPLDRRAIADGQHAAMDGEPSHAPHQVQRGDIDRHLGRGKGGDAIRPSPHHQHGLGHARHGEHALDDQRLFANKQPGNTVPAKQPPVTDIAVVGEAWIRQIDQFKDVAGLCPSRLHLDEDSDELFSSWISEAV